MVRFEPGPQLAGRRRRTSALPSPPNVGGGGGPGGDRARGDGRRGARDRHRAIRRAGAPADRGDQPRAGRRTLRRARRARRRGQLRQVHHRRHERRADREARAAAAHARPARRDARVRRARTARRDIKQDPRFRGWWPRAHPSMALVPRRADQLARRRARRDLPDRQGGRRRVHRGGRAADRDARRRTPRSRSRTPASTSAAASSSIDRGAQPARPRPARLGRAEAVRRRAGVAVGRDAVRPRRGRRPRPARPPPGARPRRRSRSCAR